jgi:hypothetical protein
VPLPGHDSSRNEIRWLAPPAHFKYPYRGKKFQFESLKALQYGRLKTMHWKMNRNGSEADMDELSEQKHFVK